MNEQQYLPPKPTDELGTAVPLDQVYPTPLPKQEATSSEQFYQQPYQQAYTQQQPYQQQAPYQQPYQQQSPYGQPNQQPYQQQSPYGQPNQQPSPYEQPYQQQSPYQQPVEPPSYPIPVQPVDPPLQGGQAEPNQYQPFYQPQPYHQQQQQWQQPYQLSGQQISNQFALYLVLSILALLFLSWPFAIPAIINATRMNTAFKQGNREGYFKARKQCRIWLIVSLCIGIIAISVLILMS